jgi:hypothetical protein
MESHASNIPAEKTQISQAGKHVRNPKKEHLRPISPKKACKSIKEKPTCRGY